MEYRGLNAFRNVLKKRQSKYGKVIKWLDERVSELRRKEVNGFARMKNVIESAV
jgi:hypothetical protein